MDINAAADSHSYTDEIILKHTLKIKYKLNIASGSTPPPATLLGAHLILFLKIIHRFVFKADSRNCLL